MELRQLEYFIITCEKGSFNQAAECLYTTQPNVRKVISSLEKKFIVPDTTVVNLSILEKFQNSFSPDFIGI